MGDPTETDRFSSTVRATVRYFNGNLLYGAKVYELDPLVIDTLKVAANTEWNRVEPAIFGRLLEHALVPSERGKLGAHFTPKPFVERLVDATMMDVLRPEWLAVEARARAFADAGDQAAGRAELEVFHAWLTEIRVLDPACGTGNFLYVSMERLMVLEGEVVELIVELGGEARLKVGPQQFLGIELNPRAAVIAELVLWIGWLRRRIENDPHPIEDPVLHPIKAINDDDHGGRDAILMRGEHGRARVAEGGLHRGEPPVHRGQGHPRGTGRRICQGAVDGEPGRARIRRSGNAVVGPCGGRAAGGRIAAATLWLRDDQFDPAGVQPTGDCAVAGSPSVGFAATTARGGG